MVVHWNYKLDSLAVGTCSFPFIEDCAGLRLPMFFSYSDSRHPEKMPARCHWWGGGGGVEAAADRTCITEDYAGLRLPMFPLRRRGKEAAAAGTYCMFHPKYGRNMSQKVNLSFNAFFPIVVHSECGNKVFYIAAPTPCVNPLNDGLPRPNHMHCTWLRGGCNVAQFTWVRHVWWAVVPAEPERGPQSILAAVCVHPAFPAKGGSGRET